MPLLPTRDYRLGMNTKLIRDSDGMTFTVKEIDGAGLGAFYTLRSGPESNQVTYLPARDVIKDFSWYE